MPEDIPTQFVDLPLDLFPLEIKFYISGTGEVLERTHVDGPGAFRVKGKKHWEKQGYDVDHVEVHITYGDGSVVDTGKESEGD